MWEEKSWMWTAKASAAQKAELQELIAKLEWTEDYLETQARRKIEEMFYMEIISWISGAGWMVENRRSWKLEVKQQSLL